MGGAVSNVIDTATNAIEDLGSAVADTGSSVIDNIASIGNSAISNVGNFGQSVVDAAGKAATQVDDLANQVPGGWPAVAAMAAGGAGAFGDLGATTGSLGTDMASAGAYDAGLTGVGANVGGGLSDMALAGAADAGLAGVGANAGQAVGGSTLSGLFSTPGVSNIAAGAIKGALGGGSTPSGTSTGTNTQFPWMQTGLGLADMYGRQQAAQAMQDRFNQVNTQINSMYAPGSPEAKLMEQEMARKDAAAGRNSQYGTRAVDLAAKLAATKGTLLSNTLGNQNNLLTAGLATGAGSYGSLANLFGQTTGAGAAGSNAINGAIGAGVNYGMGKLSDLFGNTGTTSAANTALNTATSDWMNSSDWSNMIGL